MKMLMGGKELKGIVGRVDYLDIGGMSHPSEGLGDPLGRALQQGAFIMIASRVEASFNLPGAEIEKGGEGRKQKGSAQWFRALDV